MKRKETKTAFLCVILADYPFYVLDKDRKTLSSNRFCVLKVEKNIGTKSKKVKFFMKSLAFSCFICLLNPYFSHKVLRKGKMLEVAQN